ncbi:MAG TPA: sulfite exporter TauE/SafE family protein [Symbiobacteriaceae bacterium]|nr:sulfite exporter TauE/SafE family protein [Symbiobacteriaceae bacterium]
MILALLVGAGLAVGMVGSLVGVGGGFIVVPLLVLGLGVAPRVAAGTSLLMVTANALVGALAHARRGRVDWLGAIFLTACAYPGSFLGAWLGSRLEAALFNLIFGALLIGLGLFMAYRTYRDGGREAASLEPRRRGPFLWERNLTLEDGVPYRFSFSVPLAAAVTFCIAVLGGMLGIGGGPILVPFLTFGLGYPIHAAVATSQLNIAFTSAGSAAMYVHGGHFLPAHAAALIAGVLAGAPVGAWLSGRTRARNLAFIMSGLLLLLGLKLTL